MGSTFISELSAWDLRTWKLCVCSYVHACMHLHCEKRDHDFFLALKVEYRQLQFSALEDIILFVCL